jgi:FkbM family methyltransferase
MIVDNLSGLYFRSNSPDKFVLDEIFLHDVYSISSMENISTVLDIGANIGAFSSSIIRKFPDCLITAVEPEPSNFAVLDANCGNISNITLINKAVWSDSNGVTIVPNYGETAVESGENSISVDSIAFNELLEPFSKIDLLKIDVEGAEIDIILSASPESLTKIENITGEFHGQVPEWGNWVRYLGAFFELTIVPHKYPNHMYGGIFHGKKRVD